MAQAVLCDNCDTPTRTVEQSNGWRKAARLVVHEGHPGMVNPLQQLMQGGGPPQHGGTHLDVESEHDFCSDECLTEFVGNGWRSTRVERPEEHSTPIVLGHPEPESNGHGVYL